MNRISSRQAVTLMFARIQNVGRRPRNIQCRFHLPHSALITNLVMWVVWLVLNITLYLVFRLYLQYFIIYYYNNNKYLLRTYCYYNNNKYLLQTYCYYNNNKYLLQTYYYYNSKPRYVSHFISYHYTFLIDWNQSEKDNYNSNLI